MAHTDDTWVLTFSEEQLCSHISTLADHRNCNRNGYYIEYQGTSSDDCWQWYKANLEAYVIRTREARNAQLP